MDTFTKNVSAVLAVVIVIGIMVLIALSQAVPTELWAAFSLVMGFFFGHQAGQGTALARVK